MESAGKFIDEAKVLFQHHAFSLAAFLACCGLEETGNPQIVVDFYKGGLSEEKFKKDHRHHATKAAYAGRVVELSGTPIKEGVMQAVVDQDVGADKPMVEQVWRIEFLAWG